MSFKEVLSALRREPRSSTSMEVPAIHYELPSITVRPSWKEINRYNVLLVEPADYEHSNAFLEVGELLVETLRSLGQIAAPAAISSIQKPSTSFLAISSFPIRAS